MTCPACDKADVHAGSVCPRCGVGIPRGMTIETIARAKPRRRPDQDVTNAFTDYARTKRDKND